MKKLITVLILALLTVALVSGSAVAQSSKPLAKVNGTVLTEADLEEALNEIMPAGAFHGGFSSEKRASYRPQAIEKMIEKELLYQEALRQDLDAEDEVKAELKKSIENFGGKKAFKSALKKAGSNDKKYKKSLRRKFLAKKILAMEVDGKARTSEAEIREYYRRNFDVFKRPEARRITHIFIEVDPSSTAETRAKKKAKAEEIIAKLKAGEDMAMLAWDYSEDPYRVKGGDMGFVHKGQMDRDLEKALFSLKIGELSNIIETRFGYHIARIEDEKDPEQLPYEAVAERINKKITEERKEKLKELLIEKLRSSANIEKL